MAPATTAIKARVRVKFIGESVPPSGVPAGQAGRTVIIASRSGTGTPMRSAQHLPCVHAPARDAARRADAGQAGRRHSRRPASYEPKWDGFRSIIFRDGDEVEIGSRNEKPMTRYFPEVVEAVLANFPDRAVIDGEIIVANLDGNTLDFEALQQRIHPAASRVKMLSRADAGELRRVRPAGPRRRRPTGAPLIERRAALEEALGRRAAADPRHPGHPGPGVAQRVVRAVRGGRAGRVIAKKLDLALPARQAGDEQDQARADRRLRGRRVPRAQVRAGRDRLAAARPVRRRRDAGVRRA